MVTDVVFHQLSHQAVDGSAHCCKSLKCVGEGLMLKVAKGIHLDEDVARAHSENIFKPYYTLHLWRGGYPSFGWQHIHNPAL
jgi:hypothetical protein